MAVQASPFKLTTPEQFKEFTDNIDYFVFEPNIHDLNDLGWRYLAQHMDMLLPPELLKAIDPVPFGKYAMQEEQGHFTEHGYISLSGDEWNHERPAEPEKKPSIRERLEQGKAEQERRAEIAEKYSIYEPYGMTYDTEKDRFFYNGQVVRYFKDQINSNETNGFSYDDGVIDVEPIRDEDGTLTGLKQSSDADFNARTKEQEALKAELEKAGITAGSGSFEQGDPNYRDDSLDAYTEFGVSYDKTSNHWMYDEKPIYILYDKERYTFCDKGVSDGVSLNVVRDKAGNIEKLVSVDKGELEQFVK